MKSKINLIIVLGIALGLSACSSGPSVAQMTSAIQKVVNQQLARAKIVDYNTKQPIALMVVKDVKKISKKSLGKGVFSIKTTFDTRFTESVDKAASQIMPPRTNSMLTGYYGQQIQNEQRQMMKSLLIKGFGNFKSGTVSHNHGRFVFTKQSDGSWVARQG